MLLQLSRLGTGTPTENDSWAVVALLTRVFSLAIRILRRKCRKSSYRNESESTWNMFGELAWHHANGNWPSLTFRARTPIDVRSKIARSVRISGYSENRQATVTQGMDYVSDCNNFDTNKQSCLLRCDCSVCGKSVYLFGLSNLHFCQSPTELRNAQAGPSTGVLFGADPEVASVTTTTTSLGDANSPVEITKIVYPPLLFYGANLNSDDRYEIVRDDAGRVISIVRNDTGTVALREEYRSVARRG